MIPHKTGIFNALQTVQTHTYPLYRRKLYQEELLKKLQLNLLYLE